jgi:hypothetical protein
MLVEYKLQFLRDCLMMFLPVMLELVRTAVQQSNLAGQETKFGPNETSL